MHLKEAILHKTAELDPRVRQWMDDRKAKGKTVRMAPKSILKMIEADHQVKQLGTQVAKWQKVINNPRMHPSVKETAKQKLQEMQKKIAPYKKTVDDFNTDRTRRKQFNQTPESVKGGRQHMKGAVKASTDAWTKTLQDAGLTGEMGEEIPVDIRAKAEEAASNAGTEYVKSQLGFFSDKDAANIQQYSRYRQAGGDNTPLQYEDPAFRQQVGSFGLNYGMQDPNAPKLSFKDAWNKGTEAFSSGQTPQQMGYSGVIDKMSQGYLDSTKDMQDKYSQGRQAKIKQWAPLVLGGGALLTGALMGLGGAKKKAPVNDWDAAAQNPDRMAWTKNSFRDVKRNPNTPAPGAFNTMGSQFRNFMSTNPFARA